MTATNPVDTSAAITRESIAHYTREAKGVATRARELRDLARTAGGGPEAEAWSKQADFLDQVEGAYRRQAAEFQRVLEHPTFENVSSRRPA